MRTARSMNKLGGCTCPGGVPAQGGVHARGYLPRYSSRGQNPWHTLLKILPCPNFVAGGNNVEIMCDQNERQEHSAFDKKIEHHQ